MPASPPELPSLSSDYFQFFDLPRRLVIDLEELQRRFYTLSRQLHPDRFQRRSAGELQYSVDASALLNDAYRALRDPVKRAEYLLKQEGFDIGEQRSKDVPPELLEEVFELNMALEELRHGDESARPQLTEAREKFVSMLSGTDSRLNELFTAHDEGGDKDTLARIRGVLNRRRYIQNLLRDVDAALGKS
jgi:molecular chaperone HscB